MLVCWVNVLVDGCYVLDDSFCLLGVESWMVDFGCWGMFLDV